ncbi:hypothetical protein M569_02881 [Genlisea aurea]|uniref:Uncharacterized protein n=1 Tax=Genlisea aurea TaxID=192259 RepID=S8E7S4_9LAMI|nr:hypothetical protein M569_02881 [Genlisea aurea]
MEIPQETEDYIRESIDHTVGLRPSTDTLFLKIHALEAENVHLRRQYLSLQSKFREKDDIIERSRAEASMNAVALKKFVEENQKLAMEFSKLLEECNKWKRECALYDHDRDALMDFADERAKEAEIRYQQLEEEKGKVEEELLFYKSQSMYNEAQEGDVSSDDHLHEELILLDSILTNMFCNEEEGGGAWNAQDFLDAHISDEACQKLYKNWDSLMPATQKVIQLVADAKSLAKDKDNLTVNLCRAEDEVTVLFDENNILKEEIKRLMKQCYREKHAAAGGGSSNSSGKVKRKSIPSSPEMKKLSEDVDMGRQPFSPLQSNSPDSQIRKK